MEVELVPACKELGVGIVSYSPVARGFLAGMVQSAKDAPKDWRSRIPYLKEENIDENLQLLDRVKELAEKKKCTISQLCIAWVMAQGAVPIPGTTKINHITENAGSCDVVLTPTEVEELRSIGRKVKGMRGDEAYMKSSFHER